MRRLVTLCYLVVVALALPGSAWAHATLTKTKPAFAQRLERPPKFVRLRFDESVTALPVLGGLHHEYRRVA